MTSDLAIATLALLPLATGAFAIWLVGEIGEFVTSLDIHA